MVSVRRIIWAFPILLLACESAEQARPPEPAPVEVASQGYVDTRYLMEPDQLHRLMELDNRVVVLDVRKPDDFAAGHLPQARSVWRSQITDVAGYPYGGMRCTEPQLAELLSDLGVSGTDKIVLYDAKGDVDAARLWWILCTYGHHNVALLHGGYTAWEAASLPTTQTNTAYTPTQYAFCGGQGSGQFTASRQEVQRALEDPNVILLDTRTSDEYAGAVQKAGAFKAGRIPGAIHLDYYDNLDTSPEGHLRFKSYAALREMYEAMGITPDKKIIAYCHSGVRSAHTTFVLSQLLGYPSVANYDGSWTEWSYFQDLPFETDSTNIRL